MFGISLIIIDHKLNFSDKQEMRMLKGCVFANGIFSFCFHQLANGFGPVAYYALKLND